MIDGKTLYSKLTPEDVSEYVVISGDPWRVEKMAKYLDDARHIAFSREYNTYTGMYKGVRITISSTGMGSASAVEMLEELNECGAKVLVRMGTAGPTEDDDFAKFVIATAGMANDSVSIKYAPENYPIVVNPKLVECIEQSVQESGYPFVSGIVKSYDGGFARTSITEFGAYRRSMIFDLPSFEDEYKTNKYLGIVFEDFESAPLIKVGSLMGIMVGTLCMTTVIRDRLKKVLHTDKERYNEMEEALCRLSLDSLVIFDKKYGHLIKK